MRHTILLFALSFVLVVGYSQSKDYVCIPCGSSCDATVHKGPGECESCHMPLVEKSSIKHSAIAPESICKFIEENPKAILLDVRTPEEFDGKADPNFGTLKNAINIPINELQSRLDELSKYKKQTILVFCSHSRRSPRASYLLTINGFEKVVNMDGGMSVVLDESCKK